MDKILQYFPNISSRQKEQFERLLPLYQDWNAKINVISRKDIDQLYERHVLHSLSIALFFNFKQKSSFLDVGTGGGFPGLPLAILFPQCQFTLLDSIGKKVKVVSEISKTLKLNNLVAFHQNVKEHTLKYNYVISRAVCDFDEFVSMTKKNLTPSDGGIIYLKGGELEEELKHYIKRVKLFKLSDKINLPFFETKKLVWLESSLI